MGNRRSVPALAAPIIAPGGTSSYSTAVLADAPSAYYRLGELTGTTAADSSGFGYNGTISGAVTKGTSGALIGDTNTAMTFAGGVITTTFVQTSVTAYTAETWINTTSTAQWMEVESDRGITASSGKSLTLGFNNSVCAGVPGAPFFALDSDGTFIGVQGKVAINDGKWHHLAGIWSGSAGAAVTPAQFLLYVDGQLTAVSQCVIGSATAPLTGLDGLRIGPSFSGTLDEVALYTSALTGTQLANHLQASGNRPGAPGVSPVTTGTNQATVQWTAPTSQGGDVITGYVVRTSLGSTLVNSQAVPTQTTATITGLKGGSAYTAQIRAVNRFGIGPASAASAAFTPSGSSTTYASTVLADSPTMYWRLGEPGGGLVADSSGGSNFGSVTGSVTLGTTSALLSDSDASASFTAGSVDSNLVQTGATAYSEEAWVKTTSAAQWQELVVDRGITATSGKSLTLGLNNSVCAGVAGAPFYALDSDNTFIGVQGQTAINDGKWHHVLGVWSATAGTAVSPGQFALYVDGTPTTTASCTIGAATSPLTGLDGTRVGPSLVGNVDEVAIYSTALTGAQVHNHYVASGYPPGPVASATATGGTNSASVSWSPPTYVGGSAITSYAITPYLNGVASLSQTVSAATTSASFVNLGGGSWTFTIVASNSYGGGAPFTSNPATVSGPPAGSGLGQRAYFKTSNTAGGMAFPSGGIWMVTKNSLAAMANWTVDGWIGQAASYATTGSSAGWGLFGGTPTAPGSLLAGIAIDSGGGWTWVFPGSPAVVLAPGCGSGALMCHYALSYDGATVRGYVNGSQVFSQASTSAAFGGGLAGFSDWAGNRQLLVDEFRVSNVARYSPNFPIMTSNYASDASTSVLWHFDDYQLGQVANVTVTGGDGKIAIPRQIYSDSSANGNSGQLVSQNSTNTCCNETYTFFSAGQIVGPNDEMGGLNLEGCGCPLHDMSSQPVDYATGEYWHSFLDLAVPGRGSALKFQRTYSSQLASSNGRLGWGWSDSYNTYLTVDGSGNATVHDANGPSTLFTKNGSVYTAAPRILSTLVQNGDGTFTLTRRDKSQFKFSAAGRLLQLSDRNGYVTMLAYDASNRLQTVTDPAGRTLTFAYDATLTSNIKTVTDTASPARTVTFAYDASGNMVTATDAGGQQSTFTYDTSHRMLTMKDPVCIATTGCTGLVNVYDASARVTQQTDPLGRITKFAYATSSLGVTTTITDPNSNQMREEYVGGILMSTTRGLGTPSQATWINLHDPTTLAPSGVTDPNGHSTSASYDASGNLLMSTDALNRTTTYTYNSFNEPLTIQDASGVTTTNTYDATGNLTQSKRPLNGTSPLQYRTVSYTYGDAAHPGDVTQMTDANGKLWSYTYDSYGNRTSATDPVGDKTTRAFDAVGRMTSSVSPRGNVTGGTPSLFSTTYTYNAFNQPLTVTDPLSHVTTYAYDANHNRTSVQDANSHTTTFKYDLDNEQIEVDQPNGVVLKTTFDGNGNVLTQVDGLTHTTAYTYDPLNRKATAKDPLNRTTTYGYDGAGNLTSVLDAKGKTTSYAYDAADQLTSITYSDGVTPNVTFAYDSLGQRKTMVDGTGSTSYSYDSLRRLTQSINGAGATLGYGYDLKGQLTSLTYPGTTGSVARTYDDAGRLKTVADWLSHTNTFSYDANSNLTGVAYANGTTGTYSFDNADRLTGITHALGQTQFLNFSYARANAGQLTADGSISYGYDFANRLTSGGSNGYTYDLGDHLTQIAVTGGNTTTLAYDSADQLSTFTVMNGASQVQKYTFGYDLNGNRGSRTDQAGAVINLSWDQANRMTGYGTGATYAYNGDGLRMSKTVSGITTQQTWEVAEGLPLLVQDGTTKYVTGPGGLPLEQVNGDGTVNYFHADQLGSTRALTSATGSVVNTWTYDPYGTVTASTGTVPNPFQFSGQYFDSESGLVYLRARYYDPASGQFMSRDPAFGKTREAYAYTIDSPLNATDPTGLDFWSSPGQDFQNVMNINVGTFDYGTGAAALVNAGWGANKLYTGVPVLSAAIVGSPFEVSVPVVGWLTGGAALAYGGYQTTTGVAKEGKAYRQAYYAATTPAHDCTLGANLTRFWRGVVPFADSRWSDNWLGNLP